MSDEGTINRDRWIGGVGELRRATNAVGAGSGDGEVSMREGSGLPTAVGVDEGRRGGEEGGDEGVGCRVAGAEKA